MKAVLLPVKGKAAEEFEKVLKKPSVGEKLTEQQRELIAEAIWINSRHGRAANADRAKQENN